MTMQKVIVSRHPAAIEFIRATAGLDDSVPALAEATPADVRGRVVYGNVPMHLAAMARCVYAIEFAGTAPRGAEYTLEDMRAAGARLAMYAVVPCEQWMQCGAYVTTADCVALHATYMARTWPG